MRYEFESRCKDEYSQIIDGITNEIYQFSRRNEPKFHKEKTQVPGIEFLTEVDNKDYDIIQEVIR